MLNKDGITFSKIIILIGRCDLRKGIDGLCSIIRYQYNKDPLEKDTLFLFCGTRKDRLKGVLWTGDRFVMIYVRLTEGTFKWPRTEAEARIINGEEFMRLMDGFDIDPSIGKKHEPEPVMVNWKR
ncbi:IS66 family insertion sequence element accessory protein TnpB [Butyrivibrio sp. INlla16]|uniref:IS66 family insertion sequence element accessory protein TnpB n=1 Tax=Butyrivibrio sp. INlla16 TaxID=1520807 RepID=UPI0008866EFC|nr:IS66 family insertion sequence element accessory protein TnpB [Butyrivibrio sp. INlla16]SDB51568.1 transposase [Butyrivibrio sp. INlla16]